MATFAPAPQILLVDDEEVAAHLFERRICRAAGWTLRHAYDPSRAAEMLQQHPQPSVLLLDLVLGAWAPDEALDLLALHYDGPILLHTGFADPAALLHKTDKGGRISGIISKAWEASRTIATIKAAIDGDPLPHPPESSSTTEALISILEGLNHAT